MREICDAVLQGYAMHNDASAERFCIAALGSRPSSADGTCKSYCVSVCERDRRCNFLTAMQDAAVFMPPPPMPPCFISSWV